MKLPIVEISRRMRLRLFRAALIVASLLYVSSVLFSLWEGSPGALLGGFLSGTGVLISGISIYLGGRRSRDRGDHN